MQEHSAKPKRPPLSDNSIRPRQLRWKLGIQLGYEILAPRWNEVFIDRKRAIENRCRNDISINTATEFRPQNFSYFLQIRQSLSHWILGPFNSIIVTKTCICSRQLGFKINLNNSNFFYKCSSKLKHKGLTARVLVQLRGREIPQLCSHLC